jgi:hypothetical protein
MCYSIKANSLCFFWSLRKVWWYRCEPIFFAWAAYERNTETEFLNILGGSTLAVTDTKVWITRPLTKTMNERYRLLLWIGNNTLWWHNTFSRSCNWRRLRIHSQRGWWLHCLFLGTWCDERRQSDCRSRLEDRHLGQGLGQCCKKRKDWGIAFSNSLFFPIVVYLTVYAVLSLLISASRSSV